VTLFVSGVGLLVAASFCAIGIRRGPMARWLYQVLVVAGCVTAATDAVCVLVLGAPVSLAFTSTVPGGAWRLGIDPLSALFLLAVLGVGAACAVFGTHDQPRPSIPLSGRVSQLAFAWLIGSIALVVAARSVVVFLGAWEIMAISSYVLIVTDHERAEVRRAGLIYIVATHTATLALFGMFAAWVVGGGAAPSEWSFEALAASSPTLDATTTRAILVLALVGFGFKAGCVPLHFWLPSAHAAAPSHVSALMSGIVIKTGIYGLFRVLLMLGGAPAWWGWLVFAIGLASGALGVLWALAQHDSKRLLAYHSVENIGIILIGMGVGILGVTHGSAAIAMLGFAGGLLHTINHALFKSLLFLGMGAVYRATGTRSMEELGGLARRMPLTWIGFAVGAAAIIGVPPFNGFVSEWLVYQGMFVGADTTPALRIVLLGIPGLALIGALALACFAKVSGVVFLGSPRTERAAAAEEPGPGSYLPVLVLAATCIALGVVPALGIGLVSSTARQLTGMAGAAMPPAVLAGARAITLLTLVMIALAALLWWIRSRVARPADIRQDATWACGYHDVTPRMQYTASSFAAPLLTIFRRLTGVRTVRTPVLFHTHPMDLVLDGVALPLWHAMHRVAQRFRLAQQGRLHAYLLYVMAALLVMLAYLSLAPW
jgi:hydrogenase-4 component B